MIVFDTETTGLLKPDAMPEEAQPEILDFAAVKLTKSLRVSKKISFLCRPRLLPIDPEITDITGITTEMVEGEKPFAAYYKKLCDFFKGETLLVAHNLAYDRGVLIKELARNSLEYKFPWPMRHECTVELTLDKSRGSKYKGKMLKQSELYELYFDEEMQDAHRALPDVMNLIRIIREMRKEDRI